MPLLTNLIDYALHIDKYTGILIQNFGLWFYVIAFMIIFAETGLVIAPFLPGDSLLFALGTFAAAGSLNITLLFVILSLAAILGDTANYSIGKFSGSKIFEKYPRIFKKSYLDKTHDFYQKHGSKTIVLARFVPIVRTFAPFVAGVGEMAYGRFLIYNIIGALVWVGLLTLGGYFFGNFPIIKNNFSIAIFAIIILSFLPLAFEMWKHYWGKKKI